MPVEWIIRHRIWLFAAWVLIVFLLAPNAPNLVSRLNVGTRLNHGESADLTNILATEFSGLTARQAILLVEGISYVDPLDDASDILDIDEIGDESPLYTIIEALEQHPWVRGVDSPLDLPSSTLLNPDNGIIFLVTLDEQPGLRETFASLRTTTAELETRLRVSYPNATFYWTGEAAMDSDLLELSNADVRASELRALPVTLVLLLWIFGSLIAACVPILIAVLSVVLALGVSAFIAEFVAMTSLVTSVVSLLGLALGTDYSLLMVSRFRENLASGAGVEDSTRIALRYSGRAIFLSGATTAIGFSALLFVPVAELRSVAIGGLVIIVMTVLLATTLLPAVLLWLGSRINMGQTRVRLIGTEVSAGWRWWSRFSLRHRFWVVTLSGLGLLAAMWPVKDVSLSFAYQDWLPRQAEAVRGMDRLRGLERSGLVYHLKILYEFPKDVLAFTERGWAAQKQLLATLKADTRIEEVLSLVAFVPSFVRPSELSDLIPETAQRRSVSSDGRRVLFTVIPKESLDSDALLDLAYDLRKLPLPNIDSNSPGSILVAGLPAAIIDFLAVVRDWSAFVVIAIVCATLLALAIAFRSILIPLKAVILNLLTVAAAFGAVQWIFIEGYGASWLGLSGPLDGFFPSISLLVFCIVFGISMDYEIFLITRVAEERHKTRDEPEAIVEGLTRTGPVITHLAVVMAAVFGAFALSNFPPIQMLGVALAVAVLVDAFVVRMTISPALLRLAGRWNWWPND